MVERGRRREDVAASTPSHRVVDVRPRQPVASAYNRRALIKSWLRDRPVEATTTYRRFGKVPSPGRTSCEIRDLPFGAPFPHRRSPVPGPEASPASRRTTMAIETYPTTATSPERTPGQTTGSG